MTWEPRQGLWRKQYRGQRHVVSCRQLSLWCGKPVPENKDGSYRVANEWWLARKAEVDGQQPPHPHAEYLDRLRRRQAWAAHRGEPPNQILDKEIKEVERGKEPEYRRQYDQMVARSGFIDINDPYFEEDDPRSVLEPYCPIWEDRLDRDDSAPVPEDRTVGGQVAAWLESQRKRAEAGKITADRYDNVKDAIERFRDFHGGHAAVETLDEGALQRYFDHLLGLVAERARGPKAGISDSYADTVFGIAKTFIKSCYMRLLIELPRNLQDSQLRFHVTPRKIETIADADVRTLVANATGQLKLHLLLMLNCGYCSTDIAELRDDEVDWDGGRIIRKRGKTRRHHHADVPEVNYKLWGPTFALLQEHRSGQSIVLLTSGGKPWAYRRLDEGGKLVKTDNIATNYNRLRGNLRVGKSLKFFRKTSATLIGSHRIYHPHAVLFLGHSPRGVAARNYVAPSIPLFDEIVTWLGQQYGFVDPA